MDAFRVIWKRSNEIGYREIQIRGDRTNPLEGLDAIIEASGETVLRSKPVFGADENGRGAL